MKRCPTTPVAPRMPTRNLLVIGEKIYHRGHWRKARSKKLQATKRHKTHKRGEGKPPHDISALCLLCIFVADSCLPLCPLWLMFERFQSATQSSHTFT